MRSGQQFPVEHYARKEAVRVDALHEALVGDFRQAMLILLAAVIVVLATALANLASSRWSEPTTADPS